MKFAEGHRTDVGRGRPENEDNLLVDPKHGLYAVADGMGGHRAGEVASATAIETLKEAFLGGQRLDEAVMAANAAVFAKGADDPALRGMGTTITAIALEGDSTALFGHVGDSRGYLMRDGTVTQVTADHSLVEQLVREGRLTPEEAQHHPQRAIITRALGVDAHVEVDTYRVELQAGDRFLICSDGLTNMLSDDTIAQTLRRHADPQQAADTLVDMANQAGGDDNITVVILDALSDGGEPVVPADLAAAGPESTGALDRPAYGQAPPSEPEPVVAEEAPAGAAPAGRGLRSLVLWGLPVVAVIGIAVGAVGWYARRTYYVGLSADRVTLFKGVPGGLLGWDPTIDRQTDLAAADLTEADRTDLESGHRFANKADANRFLERLQQTHDALVASTSTTTTPPVPVDPIPPPAETTTPSPTETTR